ncbi:hypothetical protein [Sphingomonas immobilis]|uniref:Uncharacterized protein n=1 Tax=Sphingomonas immobilis TaxID=3063997 RepID=A0ABT8ZU64_9SPHN|nr:hypothetical protein [Sphingomonas sp. CA1-15]MDO7841111.1 hypothetical protein [Sphingomonas sp. CA1-15]
MLQRSAFRPRKRNSGRAALTRSYPSHLKWLRGRSCILEGKAGHVCEGRMEAMHVDHAGGKGVSLKVADFWAVPGCTLAHRLYHDHGAVSWEAAWGIDLVAAAERYAAVSPHRHLWTERAE